MATNALQGVHDTLVLRGVVAILFGVAAVFWPGLTLVTLLYLFSVFILIDGLLNTVSSITDSGKRRYWFLSLILGLLEIGVGVYLLRHPAVTFATFILLVGFTLVGVGLINAVGSWFDNNFGATEKTFHAIIGLAALAVGIVILFQPESSGVAFVWLLGLYAIVSGALQLALARDISK
jgi:uncharacterized membrane protein HdeD (DUF308 family)